MNLGEPSQQIEGAKWHEQAMPGERAIYTVSFIPTGVEPKCVSGPTPRQRVNVEQSAILRERAQGPKWANMPERTLRLIAQRGLGPDGSSRYEPGDGRATTVLERASA